MIGIIPIFAFALIGTIGALPVPLLINGTINHLQGSKKAEFRQWLAKHANDRILSQDLAKMFKASDHVTNHTALMDLSKLKLSLKMDKMPTQTMNWPKAPYAIYNDELVRTKMFPMAAATYGSEEAKERCLKNTFQNASMHQNVEVFCQEKKNEHCSGFTAVSHSEKAIILAFRGTDTMLQLFFETVEVALFSMEEGPAGGKVGNYFYAIFRQLAEDGKLLDHVAELTKAHPDYELWITGHSLGGALAAIASAQLAAAGTIAPEKLKLATFGQPRTGDDDWAEAMDKQLPHFNYRVVHDRDVVAHLPPLWFKEYQHHMTEIFYNNTMGTGEEYIECGPKHESRECSDKYEYYYIRDHLLYFGKSVSDFGEAGCA